MKTFTYASAFAGIGGMTMGLKPLGGQGVIAWEYDPTEKRTQYAQNAHKLLHSEIPVHGDICKVDTNSLPTFDVFCFTPPCQTFSGAGQRKGMDFVCQECNEKFVPNALLENTATSTCPYCGGLSIPKDDRGVLTFEALRIAKTKKPKVLFMENVKGLVNHDKGNTMGTIIHAINEIGYTVDFTILNSKYFDVAQNRERVYLIAIRDDLITPEPWNDVKGTTMLPRAKRRYLEEGARTFNFDWPEQTEVRTRLRDFLEPIVDEKYYIDEDKTAKLVAHLEEKMEQIQRPAADFFIENSFRQEANGNGFRFSPHVKENATVAKTVTTRAGGRMDDNFVIEGLPSTQEQFTFDSKNEELRELVNGDSPIMLGHIDLKGHDAIKRVYSPTGQGPTLTTMGGGHREPKIAEEGPKYRIRKLTPRECLRLQSVDEKDIDLLSENFSDSRLYKFAGNGLTTNVIKAIGEKMLQYI